MTSREEFLRWEIRSHDTIDVKRCYIDLAEDLISGVLLSQIIYYHLTSRETGKTRLTLERDGHWWLVREREDWWEECRITPKQFDRAIGILESKELVVTANYRYEGKKTKHIRLNWDVFLSAIDNLPVFPISKFRRRPDSSRSSLLVNSGPELTKGKLEELTNRELDPYIQELNKENKEEIFSLSKEVGGQEPDRPLPDPLDVLETDQETSPVNKQDSGEDQSSALNFSEEIKILTGDSFADRAKYPETRWREVSQLYALLLSYLWVGPGRFDYHPALVEGVWLHKHGLDQDVSDYAIQQYILNCIRQEKDADLVLRFQAGKESLLKKQELEQVKVATVEIHLSPEPFQHPIAPFDRPSQAEESADDRLNQHIPRWADWLQNGNEYQKKLAMDAIRKYGITEEQLGIKIPSIV